VFSEENIFKDVNFSDVTSYQSVPNVGVFKYKVVSLKYSML
jgi:hypothetical protein